MQLCNDEEFAVVTYRDFISAYFAQQGMNNHYLMKYNVILCVKWIPIQDVDSYLQPPQTGGVKK